MSAAVCQDRVGQRTVPGGVGEGPPAPAGTREPEAARGPDAAAAAAAPRDESADRARIRAAIAAVADPEIPVLSIADLGILRALEFDARVEPADDRPSPPTDGRGHTERLAHGRQADADEALAPRVRVVITPTYSGCPAMETIRNDIARAARSAGAGRVDIDLSLQPAWTTDWMSAAGRAKLAEYGIAPPSGTAAARPAGPVALGLAVKCPRCHSLRTRELSRFGSTSCKALHQCLECLEPFDYFKVH